MNAWLAYYEGKPINEQGSSERAMRRLQSGGTQSESKPHTPMSRQEIEDRIAAIRKGLMSVTPDYRQNNWNHTRSQLLELASLREALMQLDGCYVGGVYYQAASGQPPEQVALLELRDRGEGDYTRTPTTEQIIRDAGDYLKSRQDTGPPVAILEAILEGLQKL